MLCGTVWKMCRLLTIHTVVGTDRFTYDTEWTGLVTPMARKSARKLRGAQKWILAELQSIPRGAKLSTLELARRIQKASKKAYHQNSVYNALRILARRGLIEPIRSGTSKLYRLRGSSGGAAPSPSTKSTATVRTTPTATSAVGMESAPHKLALGEILVLRVEKEYVLTATNLHGKLVLEKVAVSA